MGGEEVWAPSSTLCMPYGQQQNKPITICCTSHSPLLQKPQKISQEMGTNFQYKYGTITWLSLLLDHSVDLVNSSQLGRYRAAGMPSKVIQQRAYSAKTRYLQTKERVDACWSEDFITATRADRQQFPSCGFCHTSGKWIQLKWSAETVSWALVTETIRWMFVFIHPAWHWAL